MFAFIGNIGTWELAIILLLVLVVVGPSKLPEVARTLGKGVSEFRKITSGLKKDFQEAVKLDDIMESTPGTSASEINISSPVQKDEKVQEKIYEKESKDTAEEQQLSSEKQSSAHTDKNETEQIANEDNETTTNL